MTFKIGDKVTVTSRQEAYYSNFAGNPECFLEVGETGIIGSVKVPKVTLPRNAKETLKPFDKFYEYFCCIDFEKNGKTYRTSASYPQIRRVK